MVVIVHLNSIHHSREYLCAHTEAIALRTIRENRSLHEIDYLVDLNVL
jgi:hypothetical protein